MTVVEATAIIAVTVVAAVIVVLLVRLVDLRPSAGPVALRYLDAIARGDGAAAKELFDPAREDLHSPDSGTERVSLHTAALAGAHERIAAVRVLRSAGSRRSPRSFVYYSYELAGETYEGRPLALRWIEKGWRIESGISESIDVEPTFETPPVAGTTMRIRLGQAELAVRVPPIHRLSFAAYPGRYPIVIDVDGWRRVAPADHDADVTLADKGAGALIVPRFAIAHTPHG